MSIPTTLRRLAMNRTCIYRSAGAIFFLLTLTGIGFPLWSAVGHESSSLRLALTPSQSPTSLQEPGEAFAATLSRLIGYPVTLSIASDYAGVIEAMRAKGIDLAFVHPVGYVLASREAGCRILAKDIWHGKTSFTARLWVHRDSRIQTLEQLRGKTIAFVDPASSSGYVYPMVMLMKQGLIKGRDPKTFFKEVLFAGSHDAAFLALLSRQVEAAASFDSAPQQYLKRPCPTDTTQQCPDNERIAQLTFVAESVPIPEAGLCVRGDLDPTLTHKVFEALMAMNAPEFRPLLRKLYNIDGFAAAEDADYDPVRDAIDLMGFTASH